MRLVLTLVGGALLSSPAAGLTIGGRLTTAIYNYEAQQSDSSRSATRHLRAHQSARLDLGRLVLPELSFHTYVRGTTDLGEKADTDPRLRIYNAYLTWKKPDYRLQLGRQRVYAGVGAGTIDGVRGTAAIWDIDLTFYAGSLVPLDGSVGLESWSAGHLWGARLSTQRFLDTAVSLSLALRQRQPQAYAAAGQYSGLQFEPSAVQRRLLGLDVNRRFAGGHSLYGRLDYDLEDEGLRRSEVSGRYVVSSALTAQAEWFRRKPAIFANSIFSAFPSTDFQEISGRLYYRANPELQFALHVASLLYDGDSAQRAGLTASIGQHYSIGYYRTMGYARASDGLVGNLNYALGRKIQVRGELDLAAYERYQDADERDEVVTGALGLSFRPDRKTYLDLEIQGLRNALYASDMRLFVRGSRRFFRGKK